jgi:hypothetical protein
VSMMKHPLHGPSKRFCLSYLWKKDEIQNIAYAE